MEPDEENVKEKVKIVKFPMLIVQGKKRVRKMKILTNDLYFGEGGTVWNAIKDKNF